MYKLERSYGFKAFREWEKHRPESLAGSQTSPDDANTNVWPVTSFRDLAERVAFLTSMNKRLTLPYRGQARDREPKATIFRDEWRAFDTSDMLRITPANREQYRVMLDHIGKEVYTVCKQPDLGLPRHRGVRDIREIQWAIIQHYELWPTPLLDLTSSLRAAASFAMAFQRGEENSLRSGYLYIAGFANAAGSVTYDVDQQTVLARLQSACPPIAKRPHFQDGFLVGRFPVYQYSKTLIRQSSLLRRLVAKFELLDKGSFWDNEFPIISAGALMPSDDPLLARFQDVFGVGAPKSLVSRARSLSL